MWVLFGGLTKASVSILIGARGATLGAHTILQHVSLHALQAVCPQRAFTGVTAPVTLYSMVGRQDVLYVCVGRESIVIRIEF